MSSLDIQCLIQKKAKTLSEVEKVGPKTQHTADDSAGISEATRGIPSFRGLQHNRKIPVPSH